MKLLRKTWSRHDPSPWETIGQAELALELICRRHAREAFGKKLVNLGANFDIIAEARIDIEMARLLAALRPPDDG